MVKAIVWFSALGLQTKFITSLKFGLTSSVIELILVITSIGGLANLTNFLSLCFSTGISLLYAVLHAYRTEIASRRSFLIAGEVWDTPELKEDMFDSLLHKWTAEFIDPKLQIEYRGFHRLKRTKYIKSIFWIPSRIFVNPCIPIFEMMDISRMDWKIVC